MTDRTIADEFIEERRVVMKVHVNREDQMGDTTSDVVLASNEKSLKHHELKAAIEACRYRP